MILISFDFIEFGHFDANWASKGCMSVEYQFEARVKYKSGLQINSILNIGLYAYILKKHITGKHECCLE